MNNLAPAIAYGSSAGDLWETRNDLHKKIGWLNKNQKEYG